MMNLNEFDISKRRFLKKCMTFQQVLSTYKLEQLPPTPLDILDKAFRIAANNITGGKCNKCGKLIDGVWD